MNQVARKYLLSDWFIQASTQSPKLYLSIAMPVSGPLALIRQNRQQTPVVESSLNKYIASWPSPTPLPKIRLFQAVPNSEEGVVFIYLRFVYQINSHSVCAILAYILYIFGFIILPIENMVSFGIRHIYCKTALHFS